MKFPSKHFIFFVEQAPLDCIHTSVLTSKSCAKRDAVIRFLSLCVHCMHNFTLK